LRGSIVPSNRARIGSSATCLSSMRRNSHSAWDMSAFRCRSSRIASCQRSLTHQQADMSRSISTTLLGGTFGLVAFKQYLRTCKGRPTVHSVLRVILEAASWALCQNCYCLVNGYCCCTNLCLQSAPGWTKDKVIRQGRLCPRTTNTATSSSARARWHRGNLGRHDLDSPNSKTKDAALDDKHVFRFLACYYFASLYYGQRVIYARSPW
jgi:hypothetical protein